MSGHVCVCVCVCVQSSLVDIVLNGQQVVAHGLESELMQDGGHRVKSSVQDDELRASLIWTLGGKVETNI